MSGLSIQQILSSRFRTSAEADKATHNLMTNLGLSTKGSAARLAIGRSLALGVLTDDNIDARGLEVPAAAMFSPQDVGAWVALIQTHTILHGHEQLAEMDAFRNALRRHWHRGALLLLQDWEAADGDFDRFLETLIVRRAELPEDAARTKGSPVEATQTDTPSDLSAQLVKGLRDIGVVAEVKGFVHGPRITRYKIFLPDVNQHSKLQRGLIKLGLTLNLQHTQPTLAPGDEAKTVSLDVPRSRSTWTVVPFESLHTWAAKTLPTEQLLVYPGVDVLGNPFSFDLSAAPHLLIGGTTGSGKSICLHALITSLLLRFTSSRLKLALIDPKQVEFSVYKDCGYLYGGDIAVDSVTARERIIDLVAEMDARYHLFQSNGVSNIQEAHRRGIDLPHVVIFIEELADLILQDDQIETYIVRLAQKARAAGIHLILATQRPDANTFSGLIRSNIPARIALSVQKSTESKIILDETGAENLLGMGDMLVKAHAGGPAERVHGVMISRSDIERVLRNRAPLAPH